MELVDHFALFCAPSSAFSKHALSALDHHLYKLLNYGIVHKEVVRTDAGLAAVQKLSAAELFNSMLEVCGLMHYSGTLST